MERDSMTDEDTAYVRAGFCDFDALCIERGYSRKRVRGWIARGNVPRATYILPDGSEWVPREYFGLLEESGTPAATRTAFIERWLAEMARLGEEAETAVGEQEWDSYLSGVYGVCLKVVTPENIARKERLVRRLEDALANPRPSDRAWRTRIREEVAALDALVRPFTPWDRIHLGGPVSRDRLIDAPRERYPEVFASAVPAINACP